MWILGKTSYLLGMMAKVQLFGLIPKPLKRRLSSSRFKIKPAKQSVDYNPDSTAVVVLSSKISR